jgi:hypothetical protein
MQSLVLALLCACAIQAGAAADTRTHPILLPTPKKVTWLDGRVTLTAPGRPLAMESNARNTQPVIQTGLSQLQERVKSLSRNAVAVDKTSGAINPSATLWVGTLADLAVSPPPGARFDFPREASVPDGYALRCTKVGAHNVVIVAGCDARGCYYGIQTLIQLMACEKGRVSIPRVDITDWPTYRIRLVKTSLSNDNPANIARWADLLPRYKMNVLAGQYHTSKDSPSWNQPGPIYLRNTEILARAGRILGTIDPMLYVCPMGKTRGSLLDPKTIQDYTDMFNARIDQGYKSVVIDFNDWGTYKVLSPEEKARFKDTADVTTWVTMQVYDRVRAKHPDAAILVVPPVGYYNGQARSELASFCKGIPRDVLVMTTGPTVRSIKIDADWLREWASITGRKPFLWDNTLYAHLDQYRPLVNGQYNFNAFEVEFTPDMPKLLAGPGIHLNGSAQRWREAGVLTFLDYMWNPESYDSRTSLRNAQVLLWGEDAPAAADDARKQGEELYKYLHDASVDKAAGRLDVAQAALARYQSAVKRLAAIINDPVTTQELNSKCIDAARAATKSAFPEAK